MKSLTILLSIFCLLHVQLPNAFAEGPSFSEATEESNQNVEDYRSEIDNEMDFMEYEDDKVQTAMEIITLLIIMIASPIFAISCPKAPDVWINAIAGILLIVMEGILWTSYERAGTRELKILEGSRDEYNTQYEAMSAAYEQTIKAKSWMDIRFYMVVASTVLVGLALAIVLIMAIIEVVRSWGAETPKAASCYAYNDPLKLGPKQLYVQNPSINWPLSLKDFADRFDTAKDLGDAAFINEEIKGLSSGAVKSPSTKDYKTIGEMEDFSDIIQGTDSIVSDMVAQMRSLGDKVIPTANASVGSKDAIAKLASIGVGATAALISGIIVGVKALFAVTKINGWIRAGFYGVETAMMIAFSVLSDKTRKEYGKRADAYEKLMKRLEKLMAQQTGEGTYEKRGIRPFPVVKSGAESSAFAAADGQCTTGGPGTYKSDTGCACKGKGTCKKVKVPNTSFAGFKTPGVISGSAKLGENMSNHLFNGNLKGALSSADALGRNAAKIRAVNKKLRNLANKKLAEFGKKPIDFAGISRGQSKTLSKAVQDNYNSLSGADQKSLLAAIGTRTSSGAEKIEKEVEPKVAATKRGSGGSGSGKKKSIFDFLGGDDEEEKKGLDSAKDLDESKLSEYEDSSKQVSERTGTSIFKIIEVRYFKSAYPIFFEEDKE